MDTPQNSRGATATSERARTVDTTRGNDLRAMGMAFARLADSARDLGQLLGNTGQQIGPIGSDLYEDGDRYALRIALPGIRPQDIQVACGHRHVRVTAPSMAIDLGQTTWRGIDQVPEWNVGLPSPIDPASANATFENGLLTIWIRKANDEAPPIRVEDRSQHPTTSRSG